MSNSINSAAYRRELRKKKILENAELRKQKIFGLNSKNEVQINDFECETNPVPLLNEPSEKSNENIRTTEEDDEKAETNSTYSYESHVSSNQDSESLSSKDAKLVNDIFKNMPDPLYEYLAENIACNSQSQTHYTKETLNEEKEERPCEDRSYNNSKNVENMSPNNSRNASSPPSHSRNGSSLLSNSYDRSFVTLANSISIFNFLDHPASICVLSFIVCLLISLGFGDLVSDSLVKPFCLWEIQLILSCRGLEIKEESKNLVDSALTLCGIQMSVISKYIWLVKIVKEIAQDFALYFVISVLWQIIIGFPSFPVE